MENVISIQNLSKSFGNVKAVDDLSFPGEERGALRFSGGEWSGEEHDDLHHLRAAERQRQRPDS